MRIMEWLIERPRIIDYVVAMLLANVVLLVGICYCFWAGLL